MQRLAHFVAERLGLSVAQLGSSMGVGEFLDWLIYFGLIKQARSLGAMDREQIGEFLRGR